VVKPGESFEVVVEFDPAAHGLRGLGGRSQAVTLELLNAPRLDLVITAMVSLS
jgi:hypothetical protein